MKKTPAKKMVMKAVPAQEEENLYYVYENADGEGWVIVAANDVITPILAYSETGHFNTENMPVNVRKWMGKYNDFVKKIEADGATQDEVVAQEWTALKKSVRKAKGDAVVGPLVKTTWDQDDPFWNLCPGSGTTKAYTGCVATAMAQVMKYWEWPVKGTGSHTYQPLDPNSKTGAKSKRYGQQSANFGSTTYDWANMKNSYSGSYTTTEATAVATLMYHCGVASEMMYGNDADEGSGTYTVNYRVVGDINHYDSEIGEVTITINRAAAIVTKAPAAIENLKASGEDQVLITAGEAEGGEMYYSLDGTNYSTELPKALEEGKYTIYYKVIADENHYDTEPSTIEVTMAEGVKAYKVWVGDNRITGKNANDVNGDDATNGGGSFQYFENNNTLFIIGNTSGAEIKSEDPEGLTIYLFANSTNKLSSITGKGKQIITTDGNFPGSLELEGTENVISGFSSIELQENLAIINPEGIAYTNETLATKYALIGVPVEPFVEMKHEEFAGDDWNKNPDGTENDLTNFIYDDRVLFTLKFTQEADGDGVDDDGSVVLNTPMSSDEIKKIIESDLTPGSGEFAEAFTGITILIPAGEGVIEIDGRTQDGYILGVRSLFTNELIELRQSKNEEREIMVFEYKFSQPTFVGIYNYGKASAARGIGRAKKTVGSVTIHGISVKPRQVSAANCAKQASNGSYAPPTGGDTSEASGQLPPYGQDPDHPDIVSGITNVETNVTANGKWYNLNGQQIDKPTQKGLYIYKGKKIFVK
jgi:methionine-rich copper-binding protein CopC